MLPAVEITFFAQVIPTILILLSLFSSISLLMSYKKLIRVRMKSGKLTLLINICELVMTFLWLFSLYYSSKAPHSGTFVVPSALCFIIGMLEIFFYLSYVFLHLCLILNLGKTVKEERLNPSDSFKKYVFISGVGAACFTLTTAIISGIEATLYGFCGANRNSSIQFLSFALVFVINPYLLQKIWKIHKLEKQTSALDESDINTYAREIRRNFVEANLGFSLVFIVVWYPFHVFNILYFFDADEGASGAFFGFATVSFYLVCMVSFFMMLVRMRDPILKKMMHQLLWNRSEAQNSDVLETVQDLDSHLMSDDSQDQSRESLTRDIDPVDKVIISQQIMSQGSNEITTQKENEGLLPKKAEKKSKKQSNLGKALALNEYRFLLSNLEQILKSEAAGSELPDDPEQIPWNKYFYTQLLSMKLPPPENENLSLNGNEVNCFIHAKNVFENLAKHLDLSYRSIAESISLKHNEKNLEQKHETFAKKRIGFSKCYQFMSFDNKIQFQIIEKEQKFNIVEDYLQLYHAFVTSETGSLLPQLLGLYTIDDTEHKYIILLLKNRNEIFASSSETRLIARQKVVIDADYIRFENLNEDGTVQSRTKKKVDLENISKLPNMQKVIPLAPADRTRLLEILSKNLKFLDKTEIVGYKVVFIISAPLKQEPAQSNKNQGISDDEFLKNLKTIDGDGVNVFIELTTYAKTQKRRSSESALKSFSSDAPKIYRQCVDETLYQFL